MSTADKPESPERRTLLSAAALGGASLIAARGVSAQTGAPGTASGQPLHRVNQP